MTEKIKTPKEYLISKGIDVTKDGNYKLKSGPFMDLTVEIWKRSDGNIAVSMCHYGKQNGDLMKDPDILFYIKPDNTIKYLEYQNDYAGYYSEDHKAAKEFMENTWIPNLIAQGHELVIEINS
ncbi:MAG: hypothetical protein O6761_06820 [Thaumarchaeota archaeon]|nr:hypothetical protein [Nitrososphaerota archaeon]